MQAGKIARQPRQRKALLGAAEWPSSSTLATVPAAAIRAKS
jgi:hypothetical protein